MMFAPAGIIHVGIAIVLAPMMLSIINRTKAVVAGRHGQPWLQPYWDSRKLLLKSAVYSRTTTPVFIAGPVVGLAAILATLAFIPMAGLPSFVSFPGDFIWSLICWDLRDFLQWRRPWIPDRVLKAWLSREAFFSALSSRALFVGIDHACRILSAGFAYYRLCRFGRKRTGFGIRSCVTGYSCHDGSLSERKLANTRDDPTPTLN